MIFKLAIIDDFTLRITGVLSENENENIDFYENSYVVTVIKYKNTFSEIPETLETLISNHTGEMSDQFHTLTKDGHYKLDHLVIPSVEYLNKLGISGYYTDGVSFYKFDINDIENPVECSIDEIIQSNDPYIFKTDQEMFSISFLHKHYLDLCKNKIYQLMGKRCTKPDDFNMDLVWLSITAIRFNLEFGLMANAQSIVEDLMRCNDLCHNKTSINTNECRCCH